MISAFGARIAFRAHSLREGSARRVGAIALAVGCALGCAGGPAGLAQAPLEAGESRLLSGGESRRGAETLRASVDVFGIPLGTLESQSCPGRGAGVSTVETTVTPSPLVRALQKSSGTARTELSSEAAAPRVSDYQFLEGDLLRHYEVSYRPGRYDYVYDNGGEARRTGRIDVPDGAHPHDMHSAMGVIRDWRPRLGEQAHLFAVLGRRLWRVELVARGPEVIKVGGGPRLSQRIDGRAVRLWNSERAPLERTFSVWVSEDADRVPLHLSADTALGAVTVRLTDIERSPSTCDSDEPARLVQRSHDRRP